MLKDSIAEVGKLAFIRQFARSFGKLLVLSRKSRYKALDSHPKSWKAIGKRFEPSLDLQAYLGVIIQLN